MAIEINDVNHPDLEIFSMIKDKNLIRENCFIIESKKVFLKAVEQNVKIKKVLLALRLKDEILPLLNSETEVIVVSDEILDGVVKFKSHTKVFALAEIPEEKIDFEKNIVYLQSITGPENIGAIIRSALAFGYDQIMYDSQTLCPWARRPVRVSTGNIFKFNIKKSLDTLKDLQFLRSKNYSIIATANENNSIDVGEFNYPGKHVLIFGSEGHGISKEIISSAEQTIKIPVDPYVEHLNVGHAAAIFFYQLSNHKRL